MPPHPVAEVGDAVSAAVAGDRVLYSTSPRRVVRLRDDTGRLLARVRLPAGGQARAQVVASPQRAALSVASDRATGAFAGPPGGPLDPLIGLHAGEVVTAADVDGARVFTRRIGSGVRWAVHEPGRPEATIPLPADATAADFAGTQVAFAQGARVVVADWRTGRVAHAFDSGGGPFALRPDGSLAYARGDELRIGAPDGSQRALARSAGLGAGRLAVAGDRVVTAAGHRVTVVDPDGRRHRLGPRTTRVGLLAAAGARVAWTANGCLLTATVDAGAADAIPAGPCARTEVDRDGIRDDRLHRRVRLPCLAGPGGVCRVRVGRRRVRIRVGTTRWVRYRTFRQVLVVDPGGRAAPIE